ncbi:MAG: hypothetical protein ACW981_11005 [Candidatus Hodarchaeales archaeon]|jgi:hypothetical protein
MTIIPFIKDRVSTQFVVAIEFGEKFFNIFLKQDESYSEKITLQNNLYQISEKRARILKADYKDAFALETGIFTKKEIENAQLLLQADEIQVNWKNIVHIRKAYQNLFEKLIDYNFDVHSLEEEIENIAFIISLPFIADQNEYNEILMIHIKTLKNYGIKYITFIDHLSSAFYSQQEKIGIEQIKHPAGIVINISDQTSIGVLSDRPIYEGFRQFELGIKNISEYSQAILRDFNIKGFKTSTLEQWLLEDGTCDNSAKGKKVSVRGREVDIKPILNTPALLFSYEEVTGKKLPVNSLSEGLKIIIEQSEKKIRKKIDQILTNIIIIGPGASFKGIEEKFRSTLTTFFPDKQIRPMIGEDPLNAVINGLKIFLQFNDTFESYNVLVEQIDDDTRKRLIKENKEVFEEIKLQLNIIRKDRIIQTGGLESLIGSLKKLNIQIKSLPTHIQDEAGNIIRKEIKSWGKDFEKHLQSIMKHAERDLLLAKKVQEIITEYVMQIQTLPASLQPSFNQIISSFNVKIIELVEQLDVKDNQQMLDSLNKSFTNLSKETEIIHLKDLSLNSGIDSDKIRTVLSLFLINKTNYGFLDERFVLFNEEILIKAGQFLNVLRDDSFRALEGENEQNANEIILQAINYCEFLIKGYTYLNNSDLADRFVNEKETFLGDLKDI